MKVELIDRMENRDDETDKLTEFALRLWGTYDYCSQRKSNRMTGEDVMHKEVRVTFLSEEAKRS